MSAIGSWLDNILKKEPAMVMSTLVALLTQIFLVVDFFGWNLTPGLKEGLVGGVQPLVMIIFLVGPLIRQFVFAPATTQRVAEYSAETGQVPSDLKPPQVSI